MTNLSTPTLAVAAGFQSGCIATGRHYYKRKWNEQDTMRRQYESRIDSLERELSP